MQLWPIQLWPYIVTADIVITYIVIAYIVMAQIVMAYVVMTYIVIGLYSHCRYSYGPCPPSGAPSRLERHRGRARGRVTEGDTGNATSSNRGGRDGKRREGVCGRRP